LRGGAGPLRGRLPGGPRLPALRRGDRDPRPRGPARRAARRSRHPHRRRRLRRRAGRTRGDTRQMVTVLIVAASVVAALLVIAFAIWAHQYTKVGPNEVLIISGRRAKGRDGHGYRILRGGGTYVRPFREKVQRLSLELMQFE